MQEQGGRGDEDAGEEGQRGDLNGSAGLEILGEEAFKGDSAHGKEPEDEGARAPEMPPCAAVVGGGDALIGKNECAFNEEKAPREGEEGARR